MKTILVDAIDTFADENGNIFKDVSDLVKELPNRKILVTGANDEEFREWKLDTMPYEVFTLKHNPNKIDPIYFKELLAHFELTADDVIYFEHNPNAVKSAESIGIKSYHFDEKVRDIVGLDKFLDEARS